MLSAIARKESRGAHFVKEYPERREEFRKTTTALCLQSEVRIGFEEIPPLRDSMREKLYGESSGMEDDK